MFSKMWHWKSLISWLLWHLPMTGSDRWLTSPKSSIFKKSFLFLKETFNFPLNNPRKLRIEIWVPKGKIDSNLQCGATIVFSQWQCLWHVIGIYIICYSVILYVIPLYYSYSVVLFVREIGSVCVFIHTEMKLCR